MRSYDNLDQFKFPVSGQARTRPAFWPAARVRRTGVFTAGETLAQGRLRRPEQSNSEGSRPPSMAGAQNKRQLLSQLPFVLVDDTGLEPVTSRTSTLVFDFF